MRGRLFVALFVLAIGRRGDAAPAAPGRYSPAAVQTIIETAFRPLGPRLVQWALCIAQHESGLDPAVCYDDNSTQACGLFQFEPNVWLNTPFRRDSRLDPAANAKAAAWVYRRYGPWQWQTNDYCNYLLN